MDTQPLLKRNNLGFFLTLLTFAEDIFVPRESPQPILGGRRIIVNLNVSSKRYCHGSIHNTYNGFYSIHSFIVCQLKAKQQQQQCVYMYPVCGPPELFAILDRNLKD